MTQDRFSTMMRNGNDLIEIIQGVPKEKRFLLSMAVDAFLSGVTAGECMAATHSGRTARSPQPYRRKIVSQTTRGG